MVLVTEDGQVFNRQMEFAEEVSSDELARVQAFLGDVFTGKSLQQIEDGLGQGMAEAFRDPLVRMALDEVLSCLQESELSRAHRLGVSSLLTKPEFSQSQALLPVMQVLEDDTVMLHILDDAVRQGDGTPSVRIGRENDAAELAGVSVVASRYGRGKRPASWPSSGPRAWTILRYCGRCASRARRFRTYRACTAPARRGRRQTRKVLQEQWPRICTRFWAFPRTPRRTRSRRRSDAARASFTPT